MGGITGLADQLAADPGSAAGDAAAQGRAFVERLAEDADSTAVLRSRIARLILEIDDRLSDQLSAIIEAPEFRALEARWRGVKSLVAARGRVSEIKIKLLDMTWAEFAHDLHASSEMRRTAVFRIVGMRELDTLGGEPFGLIMIDHALSMSLDSEYDELFTAQLICSVAEACVCPFIMGVADDFFGEVDASWMTDVRRLDSILGNEDFSGWRALRNVPNARFLGLVLPGVLMRGRYENLDIGFRFHQWPSQSDGLWGNGGHAFLRTAIAEFRRCGWFGFLKYVSDTQGHGAVLAPLDVTPPEGASLNECARVRMTRGMGQFFSEHGFIALCESTKSQALYFVGNRSVTDCGASPSAEVLTQIQSVMIACRMVHYIKVQIRALIGQLRDAAECELVLNNWLENYCSEVGEATTEILAQYPLRGARVQVSEKDSGSARFQCDILIRPQYQVDHVLGEISLSTELGVETSRQAA